MFLAVLSIALMLLLSLVSVTHAHGGSADVNHADCGLCATAHVVVQVAVAPLVLAAPERTAAQLPRRTVARSITLARSALLIRPPPVVESLA